ncbi:hypothetical protein CH275_26350 [Rhodococcus sp. 06-235-1A]|uniref:hypothetical protein n=1 Tax=Rhodococcus sp. 06-235-1A TaxID=2022508 RepID=UPI000B9B1E44|nr:hypothetical protein [Rhodococcus sp. 06-235-1A]OZC97619.1 hypothetical protein CH275_26350 [Rhodococcus sp. 06-235-1A]
MAVDFSWSQFLWTVFVFVGVPSSLWALVLWALFSKRREGTATGPLGSWATGSIAVAAGFAACAGWLSWSADQRGEFRGPGLPAPNAFPGWQIAACGATVVLLCLLAAHLSRWAKTGGHVAALGTTAGFSTAFCISASTDETGQSGVGVILCMLGWGFGLTLLIILRNMAGARRRPAVKQ